MTSKSRNKGRELEQRVARLEFAQGSTVLMRFPVRVYDYKGPEIITDIDVLSIHFDQKLRPHMTVIECKSVRGQRGEADRLLTLAGLREFFKADQAVLVRLSASNRGREIARQLGIDLWDSDQIEQLEMSHRWVPERFGPVAGRKYEDLYAEASSMLKSIGDFPKDLFSRLCFDALIDPPHRVLGSLIDLSEYLKRGVVLPRQSLGVIMTNALLALTMAALRTANKFDALGVNRVRGMIESGVTTGTLSSNQSLHLAEQIDSLLRSQIEHVHNAYISVGVNRQETDTISIRELLMETPMWIDRFMDLASRCRVRPDIGRTLPQVVQLTCFDALTRDINWKAPAFDHLFTLEHRQLLVVALDTLEEIIGADIEVLENLRKVPFDRKPPIIPDRDEAFNWEEDTKLVSTTDGTGEQQILTE